MKEKLYSLAELASMTNSKLIGDPNYQIRNVSDLGSATKEEASFLNKLPYGQKSKYEQILQKSNAGVLFVHPEITLLEGRNFLLNEDPSESFPNCFREEINGLNSELSGFTGIHPTAVVHPSCKIGHNVNIGPQVVIDKEVAIGDNSTVGAGSFIGAYCVIGKGCLIHPRVVIREKCILGDRVILQPGVVIGSCGFGYTTNEKGQHIKLNQVGNVIIEDDVEIGANSTIDRSRFKSTRICRGTKIDNLVQIGHGATIGPDNFIVAQSGVAGSSETAQHVVIAGQCGIAGHIKIGRGVILAARTGVDKSLPNAGKYGGVPAMPLNEHNRITVRLRNIEKYVEQIKDLQNRLAEVEKSKDDN